MNTKLPYTTAGELLAAFRNGVKFKLEGTSGLYKDGPVAAMHNEREFVSVNGNYYRPDGSHRWNEACKGRLAFAVPAPVAEPQALKTKSFGEILSQFAAGTKFVVMQPNSTFQAEVVGIREMRGGISVSFKDPNGVARSTALFKPDGSHGQRRYALKTLGPVVNGQAPAARPLPTPAPTLPFLKRFVNGEPAYNPATREVVIGVSFVSGAIEVLLKGEDGKERVSTRYDHEGRHRWVPGRSLVLGKLPPKLVKKQLRVFADPRHGGYVTLDQFQSVPHYMVSQPVLATVEVEVKA